MQATAKNAIVQRWSHGSQGNVCAEDPAHVRVGGGGEAQGGGGWSLHKDKLWRRGSKAFSASSGEGLVAAAAAAGCEGGEGSQAAPLPPPPIELPAEPGVSLQRGSPSPLPPGLPPAIRKWQRGSCAVGALNRMASGAALSRSGRIITAASLESIKSTKKTDDDDDDLNPDAPSAAPSAAPAPAKVAKAASRVQFAAAVAAAADADKEKEEEKEADEAEKARQRLLVRLALTGRTLSPDGTLVASPKRSPSSPAKTKPGGGDAARRWSALGAGVASKGGGATAATTALVQAGQPTQAPGQPPGASLMSHERAQEDLLQRMSEAMHAEMVARRALAAMMPVAAGVPPPPVAVPGSPSNASSQPSPAAAGVPRVSPAASSGGGAGGVGGGGGLSFAAAAAAGVATVRMESAIDRARRARQGARRSFALEAALERDRLSQQEQAGGGATEEDGGDDLDPDVGLLSDADDHPVRAARSHSSGGTTSPALAHACMTTHPHTQTHTHTHTHTHRPAPTDPAPCLVPASRHGPRAVVAPRGCRRRSLPSAHRPPPRRSAPAPPSAFRARARPRSPSTRAAAEGRSTTQSAAAPAVAAAVVRRPSAALAPPRSPRSASPPPRRRRRAPPGGRRPRRAPTPSSARRRATRRARG